MPKFLRVGVHQSNVSGYTSKAWCIRRIGATIHLKWGAVEVHGAGDGRKVYWALPPRDKAIRCGTVQRAKADEVWPGIARSYELAKKYKIKTAWGTDVLFSRALAQQQGAILASLARWYTPAEALVMATSTNAELLALSGKRNPYPGKLGVVEPGALADLLLVDGNPLENINLIADPGKNFLVIMKDGKVYKNTLTR